MSGSHESPQAAGMGRPRGVADATAGAFDGIRLIPNDPQDVRLVENVHPASWVNPSPASRYDLVVVGAGTAGLVCAAGAAGLGARVALVERALMGGDCLNVGCVPSKALLRAARAVVEARGAPELGVRLSSGVEADFPAIMERMRRLRADLSPTDSARRFRDLGVDVFFGRARFATTDAVEVAGAKLRFGKAVVATGARAAMPPIRGLAEAGCLTNETVFALTELPRRLAVLGASSAGCELAQAFARFGSRVILLADSSQVLPREEVDAAAILQRELARDGVELALGATLRAVEPRDGARLVTFVHGGEERRLQVDQILVAAGRVPNVQDLGLEAAGVDYDVRDGVRVDDRLRTTNPRVYAAGDVCSAGLKFTHLSDAHARIVIRNALFGGRARASALIVPWCTYTDPEVARVGLSEREAHDRGVRVRTFAQALEEVDRAVLDGETAGFVKVHVRAGTDRIVGATVVACHAGDMLSELTLAMVGGLGLAKIAETIHPYPTQAEAIRKVADAYNRTRLTPRVKRLLETWLAWRR
jgi:pyruvate/2-oxoglutarate dehydrogenase complex dihydrolipoamide dehydrogenase (E3) component